MQFVVLAAAFTVFLLIICILRPVGQRADRLRRRLTGVKSIGEKQEVVDEELKLPLSRRLLDPLKAALAGSVKKFLPGNKQRKSSKEQRKAIKALQAAGISLSYEEFTLIKMLAAIVLAAAGAILAQALGDRLLYLPLGAIFGLALGAWAPMFIVGKKGKARNAAILRELPEVMDLLVVSVEAGLGLDAAITRLYEQNRSPLLVELYKTVRDVQMGLPRRESLQALADRCQVQELKVFSSSLIQAEQLGVSIKKVLRSQAEQLRRSYRQRCEAKAMKAPVKMMIPMVAFIFPVLFIILLGPSVPRILEVLG